LPIIIEQAEDEIAAVNMAVGASFAGVRSMISTSGGGFCLMTEGLGLAGMSETPLVIINAQRPGPATGLATRTAQADLLFAINASQDEFPRFVFAPGGVMETFDMVKKAFFLSEKYQVPSIILMDQFLVDSAKTESDVFKIGHEHESFLEQETKLYQSKDYLRYKITNTGISPRRIPCGSDALVRASGNEHTQEGLSIEDPENRNAMVEKRFKKLELMKNEMVQPEVFYDDSSFFLTAWGSTKGSVLEAGLKLREENIDAGWIIFENIWPLHFHQLGKLLEIKKLIMVEGNATCQMGSLITQQTGIHFIDSILKYDGRPFY
ncbi:MAG: 2-oxoacid:acceptor oxidoreductase subunit alpha, partial [Desulfobacula sp.]|nr:2-oxoacid:acceptor oxidoreductase subunit alpha [Desulfobacula sp.]